MFKQTLVPWHGRKISPVYQLLANLQEPDWKSLRVGDVLVLADESWIQQTQKTLKNDGANGAALALKSQAGSRSRVCRQILRAHRRRDTSRSHGFHSGFWPGNSRCRECSNRRVSDLSARHLRGSHRRCR